MRATLVILLVSLPPLTACTTNESDRVYAAAKTCAESITEGGECPLRQDANAGRARADAGDGEAARPEGLTPEAAAAVETRVYIDASESMKGFAAASDNSFVTVIEALGYAMPGCRLYKYGVSGARGGAAAGQSPSAREIRFSQELRSPAFYDLGFNEDDVLIKQLAQEDPPARSVLLTDGVYSARNTELQSEVVKAIEQWLAKGRFFGILIFRSSFDGRLYSENNRAWTESVRVSGRPFYAFVFSPTEKGFRELKEQLGGEVKIENVLTFPRDAVKCAVTPETMVELENKDIPPASPFFLYMYGAGIFGGKEKAELRFDMRCVPSADYPAASFKPELTLDAYTWQKDSFRKNAAPPLHYDYEEQGVAAATPNATPAEAGAASPSPMATPRRRSNLKLTLSRDGGASYSLYHLKFDLSGRVLKPAIRDLSTQDDGLIGDAAKTYRFYEFISSLTTMHLSGGKAIAEAPPVFIAVANK